MIFMEQIVEIPACIFDSFCILCAHRIQHF